jgi:hypothetical protein
MTTNRHAGIVDRAISGNAEQRRMMRYVAGVLSAFTAMMYFMIGFNVVSVLDTSADQFFGIPAGVAYAFGAALLFRVDRKSLWVLGAVLQVFVIGTYFSYAPERAPAFEAWGILIRIAQVLILIALGYLAFRLPSYEGVERGGLSTRERV